MRLCRVPGIVREEHHVCARNRSVLERLTSARRVRPIEGGSPEFTAEVVCVFSGGCLCTCRQMRAERLVPNSTLFWSEQRADRIHDEKDWRMGGRGYLRTQPMDNLDRSLFSRDCLIAFIQPDSTGDHIGVPPLLGRDARNRSPLDYCLSQMRNSSLGRGEQVGSRGGFPRWNPSNLKCKRYDPEPSV
uniref:Uncharacterized protein n=1 Tax=Compsopogon caeruleus TaxID=31354 RepID=A0A7S1TFL1_9RHOD|mmetsp:Transcript_4780/g.9666  ORF Transcript_4780/g.9666 Transcript_4780/m.9666 type:complete len:188 (+) Transcript_4780:159-722(+)